MLQKTDTENELNDIFYDMIKRFEELEITKDKFSISNLKSKILRLFKEQIELEKLKEFGDSYKFNKDKVVKLERVLAEKNIEVLALRRLIYEYSRQVSSREEPPINLENLGANPEPVDNKVMEVKQEAMQSQARHSSQA